MKNLEFLESSLYLEQSRNFHGIKKNSFFEFCFHIGNGSASKANYTFKIYYKYVSIFVDFYLHIQCLNEIFNIHILMYEYTYYNI